MIHASDWLGALQNVLRKFLVHSKALHIGQKVHKYGVKRFFQLYIYLCVCVYMGSVGGVFIYVWIFMCTAYTNKGQMKTLDLFLYQTDLFPWDKVSNNPGVRLIVTKYQQFYCVCPKSTRVQAYVDMPVY